MAIPKYPAECTEAGWKKAAGTNYAQLEKSLKVGSTLATMDDVLSVKDFKAFDELEAAVKSSEGGAVVTHYQEVGKALERLERLARLAKEYNKFCKDFAPDLKNDSKTKSCGEWLLKSGVAAVNFCEELDSEGDKLLAKAEKVPTEKITDLDWELNEWDLTHLLTKVLKIDLDSISLPDKKPVAVSVMGKIGSDASANAVLRAEFFEAAYAAGKKAGAVLKTQLETIDTRFNSGAIKGNDVPKLMGAAFTAFETEYTKQADLAIQKIWSDLAKDKQEYRSYKIKTAVSIGAKIGGIGVGVATIATTGWTGAGTIMGLIALVKSTVDLANKILDGLKEARKLAVEITDELKALKAAYAKDSALVIGTKEVSKDAVARLTGIQLSTVTSVKGSVGLFGNKIQGCNVNATKMGAEIDKTLKEADALAAKIRRAQVQLKNVKGVNLGKLNDKHDQLMVEVGKVVSAAADYKEDYKNGKQSMVLWVQHIKDLEGTVPEVAQKIQKWAIPLLDFAYVTDVEGVISKTGSLTREYLVLATKTEEEIKQVNEIGDLAGDVSGLVLGIIGGH
ncbi:MAG: hypothetical protein JWP52_2928 [Rhizobacter sp.]|jgi:hypothetical protein|nr:hypothetical protein [Rhizobacter sp.]